MLIESVRKECIKNIKIYENIEKLIDEGKHDEVSSYLSDDEKKILQKIKNGYQPKTNIVPEIVQLILVWSDPFTYNIDTLHVSSEYVMGEWMMKKFILLEQAR